MTEPDLVLYHYWRSSASYRARIALNLKGLSYDYVAVHLGKEAHLSESFRAINPQQLVPALQQRGLRGHVVGAEQAGPEQWAGMFPCPVSALPEFITGVFVAPMPICACRLNRARLSGTTPNSFANPLKAMISKAWSGLARSRPAIISTRTGLAS